MDGPSRPRISPSDPAPKTSIKHEEKQSSFPTSNSPFVHNYYAAVPGLPGNSNFSGQGLLASAVSGSLAPPPPLYASNYPGAVWSSPWTSSPHPSLSSIPQVQATSTRLHYVPQLYPPDHTLTPVSWTKPSTPSPPESSPTPPVFYPHWDTALKSFLVRLGLTQALCGFELDMLVMNSDWERSEVPGALNAFIKNISKLTEMNTAEEREGSSLEQRLLEDRKLDYVQSANGVKPQSQTSLNRSISKFLAQNRARNDASNRAEFLYSPAQKRRRIEDGVAAIANEPSLESSCARTDAKPIDRDVQMKYDIAKNEDGPLRRTVRDPDASASGAAPDEPAKRTQIVDLDKGDDDLTSARHPGLNERLANIETHFSVRYVPAPPRSLLDRLKFLEDHIIRLEKEYPSWAALHFNQPKRGWPPPPRSTPMIVPPSLRGVESVSANTSAIDTTPLSNSTPVIGKWKHNKSSLHRAVLEKLEVQKAMTDLASAERLGCSLE